MWICILNGFPFYCSEITLSSIVHKQNNNSENTDKVCGWESVAVTAPVVTSVKIKYHFTVKNDILIHLYNCQSKTHDTLG